MEVVFRYKKYDNNKFLNKHLLDTRQHECDHTLWFKYLFRVI